MNFPATILGHPLYTTPVISNIFLVKSQRVNILGFVGYPVALAATQVYHCGMKASIENSNEWVWLQSKNLIYKKKNGFEFGLLDPIY